MADTEPHAWETGRMNSITYVGLDVHKATVSVAVAEGGRGGEVRQLGVFENRPEVLSKLAARLSNKNCRISFCYEAGPCGYGLHRLRGAVIPMKAGDRVKTDRRDDAVMPIAGQQAVQPVSAGASLVAEADSTVLIA